MMKYLTKTYKLTESQLAKQKHLVLEFNKEQDCIARINESGNLELNILSEDDMESKLKIDKLVKDILDKYELSKGDSTPAEVEADEELLYVDIDSNNLDKLQRVNGEHGLKLAFVKPSTKDTVEISIPEAVFSRSISLFIKEGIGFKKVRR